jgi:hypothetical protein
VLKFEIPEGSQSKYPTSCQVLSTALLVIEAAFRKERHSNDACVPPAIIYKLISIPKLCQHVTDQGENGLYFGNAELRAVIQVYKVSTSF